MAVRIDVQAFRDSISGAVGDDAARLLGDGGVGELEAAGGGALALVRDREAIFQPWVGIVDRAFTGDCDCAPPGPTLCAHAAAVALTAFESGIVFAAEGTPPGEDAAEPGHPDHLRAVKLLTPEQLADLVVEFAARDRFFSALLLDRAGLLDE